MRIKEFPALYGLAANGKVKEWKIHAEEGEENTGSIVTRHGYIDGIKQESRKKTKPKNIGRTNETTGYEQACSEAESAWNKKRDKQYCEDPSSLKAKPKLPLPMLAHKYNERKKNVVYPCLVQPKLNGVRCLATKVDETTVEYTSRGGKYYKTLDHLTPAILEMLDVGETLDGEIFNKDLEFEEITSIVRNESEDKGRDQLQYHVYDFPTIEGGFHNRFTQLMARTNLMNSSKNVVLVKTVPAKAEDEVMKFHGMCNRNGYEGTIIRNFEGEYKFKNRSADLLKLKDFHDDEFKVVGVREGAGKFEGVAIFTCQTKPDVPVSKDDPHSSFEVVPKGTTGQRKEYFENASSYIGKMLTVRYQVLSQYGVPLFPVGVAFREAGM